uniref:Uncharacterized protein n=1 Tax=Alexandrium catenella TaxID=2925 RepID=A0A7S1WXY6_ALECA
MAQAIWDQSIWAQGCPPPASCSARLPRAMSAASFRAGVLVCQQYSKDDAWEMPALRSLVTELGLDEQEVDPLVSGAFAELGKTGGSMSFLEFMRWLYGAKTQTARPPDPADPTLGDPLRGVSVHHLSTDFMRQVEGVGLGRDSKVYDVEPLVIRPPGEQMWCPRDGQLGAAYVDTLRGEDNAGKSTIMLSYTWGYPIGDIVDSLVAYCQREELDPKRVYVWICCMCVNQHEVIGTSMAGHTVSFEDFQEVFGSRVRDIGHVVPLMTPWNNPRYLTRVWCVYEMYTAINSSVKTSIIMPPKEEEAFRKALREQTGLDDVWRDLGNVDAESAQASVEADRKNILALVEKSPGFKEFNSAVVIKLKSWMVDSSEGYLRMGLEGVATVDDSALLGVCLSVNKMLRWSGEYDRASALLERAARRVASVDSADAANLLRQVGILRRKSRDFAGAGEALAQARGISERIGGMRTPDGALLLMNMGILQAEQNIDGAASLFSQAEDLAAELKLLETNIAGLTYQWWGYFERRRNCLDRAEELYAKAVKAFEKTGALKTPLGKSMNQELGELKQAQGDLRGALEHYEKALVAHTKFSLVDSVEFRPIRECIDDVVRRLESRPRS